LLSANASASTVAHRVARHIRGHESLTDPARQDEAQLPVDHLLVLRHQRQQPVRIRQFPRNIRQITLHLHVRQMGADARRVLLRAQPQPRRQLEGQRAADGHALAMQQPVGIARRGLQRVAEGVAEVQKRTVALLGLVAGHDVGLHLHRPADRLGAQRRVARGQRRAVRLQPVEKRRIAQKPVFRDLAIAGQEIAGVSVPSTSISASTREGWWNAPTRFLPWPVLIPVLPPDGAVDLRQKRGRHLHEAHAPAQDRGGKAHQIADHPAAERDDHVAAFDLLRQEPFHRFGQMRPAFRRLAGRQDQHLGLDPFGGPACQQRFQVQIGHGAFGHDPCPRPRQQIGDLAPASPKAPARSAPRSCARPAHVDVVAQPLMPPPPPRRRPQSGAKAPAPRSAGDRPVGLHLDACSGASA
jgi:hypothetical protein